jgi:hypothetical protein
MADLPRRAADHGAVRGRAGAGVTPDGGTRDGGTSAVRPTAERPTPARPRRRRRQPSGRTAWSRPTSGCTNARPAATWSARSRSTWRSVRATSPSASARTFPNRWPTRPRAASTGSATRPRATRSNRALEPPTRHGGLASAGPLRRARRCGQCERGHGFNHLKEHSTGHTVRCSHPCQAPARRRRRGSTGRRAKE